MYPEAPKIARDKDLASVEAAMAYLGIRNPGDWPETPRLYPIIEQHILERKGPMRRGEILGAILASLAAEAKVLHALVKGLVEDLKR
ncbi:hypothetical protein HO173_011757 [Letharia columbiana]|uniref:Uncharacterized protein n=1 Tax=Letharia columbiana TaxID=112416 RepID=A0A8H6FHZ4_9LECA|nr:uncharacterized protein HO173_011757 [Letharia columbiana]KAF6228738.1 hypothetical protein HO173_011757 [Letharia columbiana]